ncbi:DNA-binding protein D-ETS-4-like isoform X4 [Hyposmocoma kahamanoa]|nr:DNA-binding protein D-ETS-4-like isoform X4 [Hyposmocoma kahamanoa]
MPQTVPRSGCSPPSASQGERAVPGSPADLHHLLRLFGAASPPESMLHSPQYIKPPPPYPEDNNNAFLERLYDFEAYPTPSPSSDEGSLSTVALQPSSPYNSFQYSSVFIKEEPNRLTVPGFASPYPLSPSGSCNSYGSQNQYSSPVPQHEEYIDIEELLKENQILQESVQQQNFITPKIEVEEPRDHILLRSALEDTTFQKRLNLRPIPLELGTVKMEESSGGANGTGDEALVAPDIDRVLSMAIEQSKRDVDNTCTVLGISPDPMLWNPANVNSWVMYTLQHFNLPLVPAEYFNMDGAALIALTEEEFNQRAPQAGSTLYAQLEIWKAARHEPWRPQWEHQQPSPNPTPAALPSADDMSDDEDSESAGPSVGTAGGKAKSGSTHIHLWQFLKELLASPQIHGSAIRWIDRSTGIFKIEDSVRVARLWGKRKNRPAMNYDKLSRSIRQYYKKGIMKKTERSQRLVYQFCHPYCL